MDFFSDLGDSISNAAGAVGDAFSEGWEDLQDAGEDLVDDLQDTWDEGTAPIEDAVRNGDFLGAVAGVLGAIGAIPLGAAGNLTDFATDVAGAITGAGIAFAGAVTGVIATVVVAGVTGDVDKGRSAGRWFADGSRQLGEWVQTGFDLAGNVAERAADFGAGVLLGITRKVQCFISWVGTGIGKLTDGSDSETHKRPFNQVNHFFVLMLENRSFDHMLGRLPGVNGLRTGDYYNWDTASLASLQSGGTGHTRYKANLENDAQFSLSEDVLHEFPDIHEQLFGDPRMTNGGFVKNYERALAESNRSAEYARNVMSSFSEETLPILYTLAKEFAVCDAWYCSVPGPTVPNRQFVHAATSGGMADSPFNERLGWNLFFGGFDYENGTVFDRLDAACIPWKIYYGDYPPLVMSLKGINTSDAVNGWTRMGTMLDFINDLADAEDDDFPAYCFIEPYYGALSDFKEGNSQHLLGSVVDGEALIKFIYELLRASKIWESSALVIMYDEHGGFYDHVPPPTGGRESTPPGDERRYESWSQHAGSRSFAFDSLGMRVPVVIVSPLIERGTVDSTTYDHSSVISTLGKRFGFRALTQRDLHANTFDRVFTRSSPRGDAPRTLPNVAGSGHME